MSDGNEQTPRMNAATLAKYQHDERMAALNKPAREDRPNFSSKRSTAKDTLGVIGFDAYVPVCDEYDTAEKAFAALVDFTDRACAHWPLPDGHVRAK